MDRHWGHKRENEPTKHHIERIVILGALAFGASAGAQSAEKQATSEGPPATISDAELDEFEARLKYTEPEMAGLAIAEIIAEQGRDRVEALLRAGQTRRPTGPWAIQWLMLSAQDSFAARKLTGEADLFARKEHFRKGLVYLQESYDVTIHALEQARGEKDTEEKHPFEPAPAVERTYASFAIAVKNIPNPPRTDRDIYNWLADNPAKVRPDGDKHNGLADKLAEVLDDYELPDYETWLRYLRKARNEILRSIMPELRGGLAFAALEAGETATAKRHASDRLKNNADPKSGNYANTINHANEILGRVALREGNVAEAKRYLLKAGQTPGSAQLNSWGPSMALAEELSMHGEREAVLRYFCLCSKFWKIDRRPSVGGRLNEWTRTILEDRIPDFGRKSRGGSPAVQRQMKRDAEHGESVKQGKLVLRHSNGQRLGEGEFKSGKPHGKFTTWYENGQKWLEWECQEGNRHGKWTDWHDNGQKWAEGQYVDGRKHGDTTYWHEDGQKWAEGRYQNGKKKGPWHIWDEHGERTRTYGTGWKPPSLSRPR